VPQLPPPSALRGIYVVRSADGGGSWGTARRLNTPATAGGQPRLVAAGTRVHCCWLQNDALFYTASPDNGASWSNTVSQVQSPQAGAVSAPALCAEADRVFLGYAVAGNAVWVSRFAPVGSTVQHTLVDSAVGVSAETQVGCAGNYVSVAWREGDFATGASRIQQAVSGDRGATFPAPAGLGNGAAAQTGPQLLHDGARLLLGWIDSRDPTAGVFVNRTAQ